MDEQQTESLINTVEEEADQRDEIQTWFLSMSKNAA